MPKNLDKDMEKRLMLEIKHWKVDAGLFRIDQLSLPFQAQEVTVMLNTKPDPFDPTKNFDSVKTWLMLKPLTIEDILAKSGNKQLSFDQGDTEFKQSTLQNAIVTGQFIRHTEVAQGIARRVS